ncbi:MAG: hypothetical protein KBC05_00425 [Candidatus Hydrogenedentes bacterium]|nr:hypothetical protein [Candidatus Hydrogenedentota bacterium]
MKHTPARWALTVTTADGRTFRTALRFNPDTREHAAAIGRAGVERGELVAFEVIDRTADRASARRAKKGQR